MAQITKVFLLLLEEQEAKIVEIAKDMEIVGTAENATSNALNAMEHATSSALNGMENATSNALKDLSSGRLTRTTKQGIMTASKKDHVLTIELKSNTKTEEPTIDAMPKDGTEAKTKGRVTPSTRLLITEK